MEYTTFEMLKKQLIVHIEAHAKTISSAKSITELKTELGELMIIAMGGQETIVDLLIKDLKEIELH